MSINELWQKWGNLNRNVYVYRKSDGWGGWVQGQPTNIYTRDLKKKVRPPKESSVQIKTEIQEPMGKWQEYPQVVKFSEFADWEIMVIAECTDPLALSKYAINTGFTVGLQSQNLENELRRRTIL